MGLKTAGGSALLRKAVRSADVLIESLRPGTMEKLGLGPKDLHEENPRLIYARYSGFGQTGPYAHRSGHDGNMAALSGVLSILGNRHDSITHPYNILTLSCGVMLCTVGILAAIIARTRTGEGQVLDHSTPDAIAYATSLLLNSLDKKVLYYKGRRPYYSDMYKTKDDRFMSVAAIEEKYRHRVLLALGFSPEHYKDTENDDMTIMFEKAFRTKTRDEWTEIFEPLDACVAPVLYLEEAAENEHNKFRRTYSRKGNVLLPNPTPRLSKTPAHASPLLPDVDMRTQMEMAMKEIGVDEIEMQRLVDEGVVVIQELGI